LLDKYLKVLTAIKIMRSIKELIPRIIEQAALFIFHRAIDNPEYAIFQGGLMSRTTGGII
jgi:hypothetical protein